MKRREPRRLSPHAISIQAIIADYSAEALRNISLTTNNWALKFLIKRELRLKRARMRREEKREQRRRRNIAKYLSDPWKV